MRRRLLLAGPFLAAWLAAPRPSRALEVPRALGALGGGGLNLYIRHGITDRSQRDTGDLVRRAGQRNLSDSGRAQARAFGEAWRALRLPLGEVRTSPVFRARDSAELAFGHAIVEPDLTADDYTHDPGLLAERIERTRRRLARPPSQGNDLHFGHIVPLGMILGRPLGQAEFPEGALALFQPDGAAARLLGILPAERLMEAARPA